MNATAKFYLGAFVALAIVVAVSFALGYRTGFAHATSVREHAAVRTRG